MNYQYCAQMLRWLAGNDYLNLKPAITIENAAGLIDCYIERAIVSPEGDIYVTDEFNEDYLVDPVKDSRIVDLLFPRLQYLVQKAQTKQEVEL